MIVEIFLSENNKKRADCMVVTISRLEFFDWDYQYNFTYLTASSLEKEKSFMTFSTVAS